ncbi:GNAT family N-acetyltransferase [Aurantibacillus circumpalustris]|uniref:GNAT family N-acetyltransferase n=1 Tax=Aurantibacillus circumpalustris TaxID=3036359 RepID=UPI00295A7E39|nr:GNAT family N-acetyltransferase [Aurantibacillus circumpalustris]
MNTILETERIRLRQFTEEDAGFIFKLLNTEGWLKYIGDRNIKTLEDARLYIMNSFILHFKKFGFGPYLVELKETNTPIGMSSLIKRDHFDDVDLGFAFLPEYIGKAYALEASKAVISYAKNKLGIKKLVAITNQDNIASINLLQKLDFKSEGIIKMPDDEEELLFFSNFHKIT